MCTLWLTRLIIWYSDFRFPFALSCGQWGNHSGSSHELQDDSALSSLCLLCRRKLIYRNALNCYCVMSGNHKGERCFKGAAKKRKRGRQKNVPSKLWDVHTSTHHQLPQTKRGHLFSQAESYMLMDRRGWNLPGIKFWHEFAERLISCHTFQDFLFHSLPCDPQLK